LPAGAFATAAAAAAASHPPALNPKLVPACMHVQSHACATGLGCGVKANLNPKPQHCSLTPTCPQGGPAAGRLIPNRVHRGVPKLPHHACASRFKPVQLLFQESTTALQ
jgi:hypothetical protein